METLTRNTNKEKKLHDAAIHKLNHSAEVKRQNSDSNPRAVESQRDEFLQLLLASEKRTQKLEATVSGLTAERDQLQQQCQQQALLIDSLQGGSASSAQTSNHDSSPVDELPMIDASEFQPVVDIPKVSPAKRMIMTAVDNSKRGGHWLGKKIFKFLT